MQKDVRKVPLPIHEEIVGDLKKPTMPLVRFLEKLISLISDRMRWLGAHVVDQQYYKNDVVTDEGYTLIAKVNTTEKPVAPPSTISPDWEVMSAP